MEPRMLDKINDLKRLNDEICDRKNQMYDTKTDIIEYIKEIMDKASISVDELR